MDELKYTYDGTLAGAKKAVKGNLRAIKEVFKQLDEGDMIALIKEVYQQEDLHGKDS